MTGGTITKTARAVAQATAPFCYTASAASAAAAARVVTGAAASAAAVAAAIVVAPRAVTAASAIARSSAVGVHGDDGKDRGDKCRTKTEHFVYSLLLRYSGLADARP